MAQVKDTKASRQPPRRPFTAAEARRIAASFDGEFQARNRALFVLGTLTGFRVMELLALRVFDVLDEHGRFRATVRVEPRNMKGGRRGRSVELHPEAHAPLRVWLDDMAARGWASPSEWLFRSRQGGPLNRVEAWRILKQAFARAGVSGPTGTHSMRKTFARAVYEEACDRQRDGERVEPFFHVAQSLGHTDPANTVAYLSFLQDDVKETVRRLRVFE